MHQLGREARNRADGNAKATWGEIDGTLANQSDLVAALMGATGLADYVIVQSKSDFPAPAGGVIQLADGLIYQLNGIITLGTDRIVFGTDSVIMGVQNSHDGLIYTGTGACVSAAGGNSLRINDLTLTAALGTAFDANGSPIAFIQGVSGVALHLGKFEDCSRVVIQEGRFDGLEDGVELINATTGALVAVLNMQMFQKVGGVGNLFDLGTSVWDSLQIIVTEFVSVVGGTDISGAADSANLTPGTGRARVLNCIVNGAGTRLDGITLDDALWAFVSNTGLADSIALGALQLAANTTDTTIVTQNVFVKAAGTTTFGARRYDDDSLSNNLRYIGKEPITTIVNVSLEMTKSGPSKVFNAQIFKGGIAIGAPMPITVSTQPSNKAFALVVDLLENDNLDLRIANTIDDDDGRVTNFSVVTSTAA